MYYNHTSFHVIEDGNMITYAVEYFYGEDRRSRSTPVTVRILSIRQVMSTTTTAVSTVPTESEIIIKIKILQKNKV